MSNNKDFKVKNGILPTSYQEGLGTVVSGVSYGSVAQGTYAGNSFNFRTDRDYQTNDIYIKPDGTKAYIIGALADKVFQYSLSTAWDISTASYDSIDFSVASQGTAPDGLFFSIDGTSMYVSDIVPDTIYQYTLSTAWDLSTASYASKSFDVSSQASTPASYYIKPDGTKLYVNDSVSDSVYQYTLSTAWDISTASYDSVSLSTNSVDAAPNGLAFRSDGTRMYVLGTSGDAVYEYSLSTAWDLSTAVYTNNSLSVASQTTAPYDIYVDADAGSIYVLGSGIVYQYSTALATNTLDLSTGSVFDLTPTSDAQVTLSNPAASGTVSQATLLLGSEDSTGVASAFSTTIYTGNNGTQTITNGIDLAGDGGLVWTKDRSTAVYHALVDTERGGQNMLVSSETLAQTDRGSDFITSFNSNGYSIGADGLLNDTNNYVSWTFKKQAKFFTCLTYTGNGVAGRTISHDLGTNVGMLVVKRTDAPASWMVYHVGLDATSPENYFLELDNDNPRDTNANRWDNTAPTNAVFTVGAASQVNQNNATYVAYLFAHDTDASSLIKCGSYTGTGSTGKAVTLGWEPQWLMIKRTDAVGYSWEIMDAQRGFASGNDKVLRANSNGVEITAYNYGEPTSTGFEVTNDIAVNASGGNYIYMAIRSPYVPTITYDPTLEWPNGTAPTAPAIGETDVVTFNTSDGGTTYSAVQAIDGAK